ncbi:UNVERIFIED_CONTAM: hypothetical protein FKN15_009781 [Acipenser sinensis]
MLIDRGSLHNLIRLELREEKPTAKGRTLYPQSSDSKSKCNISEILKDYKVVIFQDIKTLNLTGLEYSNKNRNLGNSCQSDKEYKILQSIYKMTLLLKCQVRVNKMKGIKEAVRKTTMQIESAINQHCKKMNKEFFSFAAGPDVDATLRKRAENFKSHLTKKFRWDFEPDPEECAPVVVELPEGVTLD